MSEDKTRKTGSGGSSRSGTSGKTTSKSGSGKSAPAKNTSSRPSGSKSGAAKSSPAKSGGSKSGAAKSSSAKSGSGKSGSAKTTSARSGGNKSTSAKSGSSRPSGSKSAPAKGSGSRPANKPASGKARYDEPPRNPRRYTEDEIALRNSPNAKRMQEERRRRKYSKNQRMYNILLYSAVTIAVLSVIVILSFTVLFNITDITVERGKNIPYSDEEILTACGIEPGDNLFAVDLDQASLDVTTKLPYIEVCNISRRLPSKLELDVHSAVVLGAVTTMDGKYIVLSASGRALEYADGYTGANALTHINGMEMSFGGIGCPTEMTDPDQLDVAAELVVGMSLYNIRLDSITFDKAGAVTAEYDGRIRLRFGVPTNLSQKIQLAASMITEGKIAKNESGILDLSIGESAIFTADYLLKDE